MTTKSDTSRGKERSQHESRTSPSTSLIDSIQTHGVSDPECAGHGKMTEEKPGHGDRLQLPSSSRAAIYTVEENEETIITNIHVTDVALGLRRVPAGFYTVVHHSGLEWRTENKPSLVNDDVIEWSGPIPIPPDASATVCIEVYASFEFQPTLGVGEQLRQLTITVEQLLDRNAKDVPFILFPQGRDVVSPCSSILVTVRRRKCESSNSSASMVLGRHCSTTESSGELEDTTIRGHSALSRYRKYGDKQDLERCIEDFERALNICPLDHPCRAAAQSNLAIAKFIYYQVEGTDTSFEVPLSLYCDTLAARPVGHLDRPSTLIHLAMVHFARFQKRRDDAEGARIEALLHEAMELSSTDSHENWAATFMLKLHAGPVQVVRQSSLEQDLASRFTNEDLRTRSVQLLRRFERFGDLVHLQQAITLFEESARSTPVWDDRYRTGLVNLGVALTYRFEHLGELSDLEDAISKYRDAVDLTPYGHPDKSACLTNLGTSFKARFERLGELSDLERAISTLRDAVHITPDGHPHKPALLNNLGDSFTNRFEHFGELSDLEHAISTLRDAVDLTAYGHPHQPVCLFNLGSSLRVRFERLGESSDLEHAISMLRDAVNLTPNGHPDKPARLNNLGSSFFIRFECLGKLSDLEDAISALRDAIDLTPYGHPGKSGCLNSLGTLLKTRFDRLGVLTDIDHAISMLRHAVHLIPHGHPDKPACLTNLGSSLQARFQRIGELSDLENAVSMLRDAVDLTPHGHPQKPAYLTNLGTILEARFQHLGELSDLDHAISTLRAAVDFIPDGHPRKPFPLSNLGVSLQARFERRGELSDLENAISMLRDAVDLTPHGHPHKPACLNNLGCSFGVRFERHGELSDLERAISTLRDAVDLSPHGHPDKPKRLNNLGNCFVHRFELLGELSDLEHAILMLKDAVALTPHAHAAKHTYLNSLGNSFTARFQCLGELSDIENAISTLRDAVDLTPHGHPDKHMRLYNLGNSFLTRFRHLGGPSDLEDAISTFRDAVELTHHGHPHKPRLLTNLGNSFKTRFDYVGELGDLGDAISMLRDAVDLTPHGHRDKPTCLNNLGTCLSARFQRLGELGDLEDAISVYSHAASAPIGPVSARFSASRNWILCARRIRHRSLLDAYSVAISLLPQLAWIGLSLTQRYTELTRGADVVREAAAAALDLGFLETAVEWLEQGRSIVWGELFQLRSAYEELSSAHPEHTRRLRELSAALEHASVTREKSSTLSEQTQSAAYHATESLQQEVDRHRTLAIARDKLLQVIRRFPGFEQFLLRKGYSQLRRSAHSGPVVILNAAQSRCDALIVLADLDHVIHVPLPDFNFQRSTGLQNMMVKLLGHGRAIHSDDRKGVPATLHGVSWESLLSTLWNGVVKPILNALVFSTTPGDLSRIFWCPTGPFTFLPIHAAGLYGIQHSQPGHKVSDFVVSSYVPTLSILVLSPNATAEPSGNFRLLAVCQPPSDGQSRLPGVDTELEYIKAVIRNSPSGRTTLLESSAGTVEEVLSLMKEADWVHFACHGIQDAEDSGLCLADRRRLKLRDIIALSRPHGGLAFLSACETATGDARLSDEAIHIAAGMLFSGYGGVVGTMWSISDELAPEVARDVYQQLFGNGTRPDYREAARALHDAIGRLRERRNASFHTWLPFIHVGL